MNADPVANIALNAVADSANENMQTILRTANIVEENTSKNIAISIYNEMLKFQSALPDEDDVAISYISFGNSITILVENMGYIGSSLVVFYGRDSLGKPQELIQHIHQLNFLLTVAPKAAPETPKRKIGFVGE